MAWAPDGAATTFPLASPAQTGEPMRGRKFHQSSTAVKAIFPPDAGSGLRPSPRRANGDGMDGLFRIECTPPWLTARFADRQRMAGWSLNRPGIVEADTVAWLQVFDADLPLETDPLDLLERRLRERGLSDAVGLMTARDVRRHHFAASGSDGVAAEALVTLGLTNGVGLDAAGRTIEPPFQERVGTINTLVAVSRPLSVGAALEALSLASAARTAALLAENGPVVGTGTDCIIVASPVGIAGEPFAGLHTAIGQHVTASVFQATRQARARWEAERETGPTEQMTGAR